MRFLVHNLVIFAACILWITPAPSNAEDEALPAGFRFVGNRMGVDLEIRPQRFTEGDSLGGDNVHQGSALKARKHGRVDLLRNRFVVGQDHAAARPAQGLVGGRGHHVGVGQRAGMDPGGDQAGEMGHVDHEKGPDLVGDFFESGEIQDPGIGRRTTPQQFRSRFICELLDGVVVEESGLRGDTVLDRVVVQTRDTDVGAVREVPAAGQGHAHDTVPGFGQRHVDGLVRRRAGVRLHVDVLGAEQKLRPLDGQRLDFVDLLLTLVVPPAGVPLGVLVEVGRASCRERV